MLDNVTVVIRSVGERTEKACYSAISELVASKNIFVVHQRPFSAAVKANFEIGMKQNKEWTLAVDADLILYNGAIKEMIAAFSKLEQSYFIYQGWVYDKFFKDFRTGGPHLYRTELLHKAIDFIPDEGTSLRPESSTYIEMDKLGHGYFVDNNYYGLHDFEQNKTDIYRKFFLHAQKHRKWIPKFLEAWKGDVLKDEDYVIAMRGLCDGLLFTDKIFVDAGFFEKKSKHLFEELGVTEKSALTDQQVFKAYFDLAQNELKNKPEKLETNDSKKQVGETKLFRKIKNKAIRAIRKK